MKERTGGAAITGAVTVVASSLRCYSARSFGQTLTSGVGRVFSPETAAGTSLFQLILG